MTDRYVHLASECAAIQKRVTAMDRLDVKPMRVPRCTEDVAPGQQTVACPEHELDAELL
jgi:hypothetical protein